MRRPRILIACIGNIFLGDDAFGVEVGRALVGRSFPEGVHVVDFGIRGMDLTFALMDGCDVAIMVDAVPRGARPGTLCLLEPVRDPAGGEFLSNPLLDGHGMDPAKVLRSVARMGGKLESVYVVGCEPAPLNADEEMQMELSPAVAAAVPRAVEMIETLVKKILGEESALDAKRPPGAFAVKGDVAYDTPSANL